MSTKAKIRNQTDKKIDQYQATTHTMMLHYYMMLFHHFKIMVTVLSCKIMLRYIQFQSLK